MKNPANASSPKQKHRIDSDQNESYKGIPIYTARGTHGEVFRHILAHNAAGGQALELGAGGGAFSQRLVDGGFDVTSSDLSREGFQAGNEFVAMDLNQPFADILMPRQFDLIVAVEVIEHLESFSNFAREVKKLLRPNGSVWLTFPNIYLFSVLPDLLRQGELVHWSRHQFYDTGHQQIVTDWLVELLCEKNSLKVVQKYFVNPVDFRQVYPGVLKRTLALLSLQLQTVASRFRTKQMCLSVSVLLQIRHAH